MRSLLLATTLLFSTLVFAQGGSYSISETTIGTLVADPAAAAILEQHVPGFTSNPQILAAVQGMTLVEAQQAFNPEALTDEKLEEIQVDLTALPAN